MITVADRPARSAQTAKLLVVEASGPIRHLSGGRLIDLFRPGDVVVANDAATLPASLRGEHVPSGRSIEVRLATRRSLAHDDVNEFVGVLFGEGDFRTRTEHRQMPPAIAPGDRLRLGPLA